VAEKAIEKVQVGFKASVSKTITPEVIRKFAEVSEDHNPLHLDEEYAKKTVFGERIAHGILAVGFISAALTKLPGTVVYLSQTVEFSKPVKIGDTIEAIVEVEEITREKSQVKLKTYCQNQRGEQVLRGEAKVKLFDLK